MGIRESLLNTITSVGSSDFVRIVTSAGVSSKATVQNLFKSFETGLGAKSSLTTSDYVRVVGSDDVAYKQSIDSIKDWINLNMPIRQMYATSFANLDTQLGDISGAVSYISSTIGTDGATSSKNRWTVIGFKNPTDLYSFQYAFTFDDAAYVRTKQNSSTWSAWEKLPTRTEMSDRLLELPPSNDFNAVPKTSGHISFYRWGADTLNSPYKANAGASDTGVVTSFYSGANYGVQFGISSNREEEYIRKLGGGTWGAWTKLPTRAEVDALKSKSTKIISSTSTSGTFTVNTYASNASQFIAMTFGEVYVVYVDWSNNNINQTVLGRAGGTTRGVTFSISDASTHTVAYTATASLWGGMSIIGN